MYFILGDWESEVTCFPAIERVFNPNIPFKDRFITESEHPPNVPPGEQRCTRKLADDTLQPFLQDLSKR